jgi:two-component system chemotaxis sensor kinase CheA
MNRSGSRHGRQDFRALFGEEARGRLTRLGQLLLDLEGNADDPQLVVAVFREVHTLKGAAAVVGFEDVSRAAHALEEVLDDVRNGRTRVDPNTVDHLLGAIDSLRSLTEGALAGQDQSAEATRLAESLHEWRSQRLGTAASADESTEAQSDQPSDQPTDQPMKEPSGADQPDRTEGSAERAEPSATPPPQTPPRDDRVPAQLARVDPVWDEAAAAAAEAAAETLTMTVATPPVAEGLAAGSQLTPSGPSAPRPTGATASGVERQSTIMVPLERLDDLVRLVSESASAHLRVGRVLHERLGLQPAAVPEFNELSRLLNELQEQAMRARMVPLATITDQLHRAARDLARGLGKEVRFEVNGEDTELDRGVLHELADSLLHLVRNAVDHGVETPDEREAAGKPRQAVVRLHAMQLGSEVIIAVSDDGRGIDIEAVRRQAGRRNGEAADLSDEDVLQLIFRSGLSTARYVTDVSGRGIGLDVVQTSVEAARGRTDVRSEPGRGTEFRVVVPVTLAVQRCLVVAVGRQSFALPLHRVVLVQAADEQDEEAAAGRQVLRIDGVPVPLSDLATTLELTSPPPADGPVVVLSDLDHRHAFRVDRLIGQRDVVIKGLTTLVPRLGVVAGASVDADGAVLVVLDPPGLLERAKRGERRTLAQQQTSPLAAVARRSILVVDDALTVRELQRSILQRAGFDVNVASDGVEALSLLADHTVDLVLTDIDMPRMDGFELTESIRALTALANLPVVILSSRASDDDKRRGMEVGADAYIVKSAFDEHALLSVVQRLLGEAG